MAAIAQGESRIRLEWGAVGASHVVESPGLAVVVDVLSFTTALTVAVEIGAEVYPYEWQDDSVEAFAAARDARHAVGRFEAQRTDALTTVSLSPARLQHARGLERLVLPSPNGSSISFRLRDSGAEVLGASFRNCGAVGRYVAATMADNPGWVLSMVASGERWEDGSLRPAVEDLWGCGAVLAALRTHAPDLLAEASPEALAALGAYDVVEGDLTRSLIMTTSGQELVQKGFRDDVLVAGTRDVCTTVPVLRDERFVAAEAPVTGWPPGR